MTFMRLIHFAKCIHTISNFREIQAEPLCCLGQARKLGLLVMDLDVLGQVRIANLICILCHV